jgi:type I restriction-modification system DNA methylase subunit
MFRHTNIQKYIEPQSLQIQAAFEKYVRYFHNEERQDYLRQCKEEQFQEGFLRELFVNVLEYKLFPEPGYNLVTEKKNVTNAQKADGAILVNNEVRAVIELKDTRTVNLRSAEGQAFGYKYQHKNASYVITSNFEKLRFYIDNAVEFQEWNLFTLTKKEFELLYLCLACENLEADLPLQLKKERNTNIDEITKDFYARFLASKRSLLGNLIAVNPGINKLQLLRCTQKLLDRIIFILFAKDCGLLNSQTSENILTEWDCLINLTEYSPLYDYLKRYFSYINKGRKDKKHDIFAYNGGLFQPDETLDHLHVDDDVLRNSLSVLSKYDFKSEIDVNVLGRIFEQSLNDLEEIKRELSDELTGYDLRTETKRKRDGIFYTPRYITSYIIENTLGKLCYEKKAELEIDGIIEFEPKTSAGKSKPALPGVIKRSKKEVTAPKHPFAAKLEEYRNWLFSVTVCDPACGSGAFLNAALDFLRQEHHFIDEMAAKIQGHPAVYLDVENEIMEKNLYGVDINEESVEITRLALWIHSAKPFHKLNSLDNNIKVGNSLISGEGEEFRNGKNTDCDTPHPTSHSPLFEKAFDWHKEFPHIFEKGGFDVVVGNPPYGSISNEGIKKYLQNFDPLVPDVEIYIYFISLYKTISKDKGLLSYICPNTFLSTFFGKKYRDALLDAVSLYLITDVSHEDIFEDASVRNCIIAFSNEVSDYQTDLYRYTDEKFVRQSSYTKSEIRKETGDLLNIFYQTKREKEIIVKLTQYPRLNDFFDVSQGLIPYDKYRGHDDNTIRNRIWHSHYQKDKTYKKELKGGDITRYSTHWNGTLWISYGEWLAAPREQKFFTLPRILVREITADHLFCTYTEEEYYNTPSLINIICEKKKLDLKYCLAILNSKLIGWLHNKTSPKANKGLFPKILINDVRHLPLIEITKKEQKPFIVLTGKMLALHADLQAHRQQFGGTLSDDFDGIKITGTLEKTDLLDFKTLLAELKKQKISIPHSQREDWKKYFNQYKMKCQNIIGQITDTDNEIDRLVYELYGLTDEEVKIIETLKG